jgi:nucleoid DNA-binding protein
MTKRDLVNRISAETGLVQQNVLDIVQKTLDHMSECLARGEKVELRNFGVFEIKVRKARIGRNPNQPGTDVPIPERAVVKFKAGKEMREAVSRLDPSKVKAQDATASESEEESDDADEAGAAPAGKPPAM